MSKPNENSNSEQTVDVKDTKDTATKVANTQTLSREEMEAEIRKEIAKETQAEIDRRVTEALKKKEAQAKAKLEEAERRAKLSEEEKLAELKAENERALKARELELNTKELKLSAIDYLTEKGCDISITEIINIDNIASLEDSELRQSTLTARIDKTLEIINNIASKREEALKKEILRGQTPASVGDGQAISNYERAKSNKDVKSMLLEKFS